MRKLIEQQLPGVFEALRILKSRRFEIFPPRITYALGGLHQAIKRQFGGQPGIFFEVGANNGIDQSNTVYLEKYCGWSGILVEPVAHKFVQCLRNRPHAVVVHAALTPFDFPDPYVEIIYSNLMSISTLSEMDAQQHVNTGAKFLSHEVKLSGEKFLAPARTVDSILAENNDPQIDLFSLDVEGAELQVLQGINFDRTRPSNFLIEVRDMTTIGAFMQSKGYEVTSQFSFHDYLFSDTFRPTRWRSR